MYWAVGLTMSFWLTAQSCDSAFPVAWQLHVITKKLILNWNRLDMVIYVGRYSCSGKTILFLVSVSVSRFHMMNCSTSPVGCILPKKVKIDCLGKSLCREKKKKENQQNRPPCYSLDLLLVYAHQQQWQKLVFIPAWIQCRLERWNSIIIIYTTTVPKSCQDLPKISLSNVNINKWSLFFLNNPCSFFCIGSS